MVIQKVGHFKGMVKCFEPSVKKKTQDEVNNLILETQDLLSIIYEKETKKKWDVNLEKLFEKHSCQISSEEISSTFSRFKECVNDRAGMSQLKIVENIGEYIAEQHMHKRMSETNKCKIRLYMIEGFNFA